MSGDIVREPLIRVAKSGLPRRGTQLRDLLAPKKTKTPSNR